MYDLWCVNYSSVQTYTRFIKIENYFSYFSTKTYVVGTQKTLFNERVLLSTLTYILKDGKDNNENFTLNKVAN